MFFSFKLEAQSYIAGNMTYYWLYGYTYKVTLTTFTQIGNAAYNDPCEDTLCFGDGTGAVVLRSNGICGGSCSPACDGVLLSPTIKMNEYITTHTYPGPGNYLYCFDGSNRTLDIINIPNSVNQTMALESKLVIPTFGLNKNNSPVFANHPIASGCFNNGCFTYNPSATDVDGDSLSYSVSQCLNPGSAIPSSGAGGTFSLNPVTGTLNWCSPQFAGDYNVLIKITEWRKDDDGTPFIVGYVNRDTRLSAENCTSIYESKSKESKITVSPNPFNEIINISFNQNSNELFTIELLDVTGRKIKTITEHADIDKQKSIQIKLENISEGIYFLKLTGNNHTVITKKIIKQ